MEAIWTMTGDISRFSLPRAAMLKALCAQMRMCRNLNLSRLLGCGAARPLIALNLYTIPIVGDSWVSPGVCLGPRQIGAAAGRGAEVLLRYPTDVADDGRRLVDEHRVGSTAVHDLSDGGGLWRCNALAWGATGPTSGTTLCGDPEGGVAGSLFEKPWKNALRSSRLRIFGTS